jgi:hypothetical protein
MPHVPLSFPCRYCSQTFKTSKGRSNHLSQSKACHEQLIKTTGTREQLKRRHESHDNDNGRESPDNDNEQLKRRRPLSDHTESQNEDTSSIMDVLDGTWEQPTQRSSHGNSEVDESSPTVTSSLDSHSEPEVDMDSQDDYVEDFPWSVAEPTGKIERTIFEKIRAAQENDQEEAWGPFKDEEEWDLARWLMTSSCSQTKMDDFLKLPIVCTTYID